MRQNKTYESNTNFPNLNPYPDDISVLYVINETTIEGKMLADKIQQLYPFYDFVENNGVLIDVVEQLSISYTIDNSTITTTQIATIEITDPFPPVPITVDGIGIETDGIIEYSNENVGIHQLKLKADGYKDTVIEIEVV